MPCPSRGGAFFCLGSLGGVLIGGCLGGGLSSFSGVLGAVSCFWGGSPSGSVLCALWKNLQRIEVVSGGKPKPIKNFSVGKSQPSFPADNTRGKSHGMGEPWHPGRALFWGARKPRLNLAYQRYAKCAAGIPGLCCGNPSDYRHLHDTACVLIPNRRIMSPRCGTSDWRFGIAAECFIVTE